MDLARPLGELIPALAASFSASETAHLDVQVLLAEVLGRSRSWVLAHPEARLDPAQQQAIQAALEKLTHRMPLPYVLGHWSFFGLDFIVTPDVLIPRPETELLVERALAWLRQHPGRRRVVDVGTGSGCIAVALAATLPDLQVTAVDLSPAALAVAGQNVARHNLGARVGLVQADLLPPGLGRVDLICANLPYIPTATLATLEIFGQEPTLALDGGSDGLALIRRLLSLARAALVPDSLILLEIEATLGQSALQLAVQNFPAAKAVCVPDLAGKDRLIEIRI